MLGLARGAIVLAPYDDNWHRLFEQTRSQLVDILGNNALAVHHIGSTAIPAIVAKPILDVAVELADPASIDLRLMALFGYVYRGESGIPGRYLFVKYRDGNLSTHHIHCYKPDHPNLLNNIAFRDYLNAHPDWAARYGELKLRLSKDCAGDRARYTQGKTDFINAVLALSGKHQTQTKG